MSVKRNSIILVIIFSSCLFLGYIYALSASIERKKEVVKATAEVQETVAKPPTKDYFEEYRLERDKLRSRQVELLREMVNNSNSAPETRKDAQKKILSIVENMEKEVHVESILIARGFKDAVVFIRPDNITVIIKSFTLLQQDTLKVQEIVSQLTSISSEEITVLSKK